jgi:riboflavin kinase/FMN adenylyltransferase
MQHYHSLREVSLQTSWLTVGVFDGVHRGHQEILRRLTTGARTDGAPAVVLTFHPHPAVTLGGRADIRLLSTPEERVELLAQYGVDVVITHPFDRALANTTAYDFMSLLKKHTGLRRIVLGYDAALGKGREGNAARLTEIGHELGYSVEVAPALGDESGVVSSTEIRKLVTVGNVSEAARLLGHPYSLRGPVIHGDGRGRRINVPTANISYSHEKLIPATGIYACWAYIEGDRFQAAVNVGYNPTFTPDKETPNVEAHIIDFNRDLYGQVIKLDFVARLRAELKFTSVDALIEQIWKDVADTRALLNGTA